MADTFKFVQAQNFSLAGGGAIAGATTVILKSFTGIDGALLTMSDFGTIGFGTLEPGNGNLEEQISFTGVVQNVNGTATLTGVSNVTFVSPYTASSGLAKTHAGSTTFIISNTAGFYDRLTGKGDDEVITGVWTFTNPNYPRMDTASPPPTDDQQFATKKYADDLVIQGAAIAATGTLGIVKISVDPASATGPIAVGTNDPRFNTQSSTALNGTSNKIVDTAYTTVTGTINKVPLGVTGNFLDNSWIHTGTGPSEIVLLDGSAKLPAIDGSALTNLPSTTHLGSWTSATADGSAVLAGTDGFIVGYLTGGASGTQDVTVKTDASNPPTTVRSQLTFVTSSFPASDHASFFCPVKKGDYYSITLGGNGSISAYFIPLGT